MGVKVCGFILVIGNGREVQGGGDGLMCLIIRVCFVGLSFSIDYQGEIGWEGKFGTVAPGMKLMVGSI